MNQLHIEELKKIIAGDVVYDEETLTTHSHDASLFEIKPELVIFPKHEKDVETIMSWAVAHKAENPTLSITARSGGTCMSGGSLNNSIILDFSRYINRIIEVTDTEGVVEPGCFYRDFEKETLQRNRIMPAYTASKEICAVGGMVANNSGGEKTIKYGKVENYVKALRVVFTDGKTYTVTKMTKEALESKIKESNFEGSLYKKINELITANSAVLKKAKPNVSKNSAGYYLWNIWDEQTQTFDLCKLITGSQGTLGIVTQITFSLVPVAKYSNVLAVFLPKLDNLGKLVNEVLPFKPDSLESYDDYSMKLAVRFFVDFITYLGPIETIKLGLKFLPEAFMMLTGGIPKLTIIIEVSGFSEEEVRNKLVAIEKQIKHFGYKTRIARDSREAEKYWRIRRESFNLLRKHIHGKRTAPFIDDIVVLPEALPEFLPKVQKAIAEYKLVYTVAGHAGDGNFHIIPLMDLTAPYATDVILDLSKKIYDLVSEYKGSITAEHNDGIIRTPYLLQMYGVEVVSLFKETKEIFDPLYILNPRKKVGGTFEDIKQALSRKHPDQAPEKTKKHAS